MMRIFFFGLLIAGCCSVSRATDQPILLVTPKGAWQITVTDGVPGAVTPANFTVIVQGFGNGGGTTPNPPTPDNSDPVVTQVAALSASPALSNKSEGTAAAALVNSLSKMGLTGKDLKDAILLAAPFIDSQLKSGTRLSEWAKAVTAVTVDPTRIIAGLTKAWGIDPTVLSAIHSSAVREELTDEQRAASEAFDITTIFTIIQMIIQLLQSLGILK